MDATGATTSHGEPRLPAARHREQLEGMDPLERENRVRFLRSKAAVAREYLKAVEEFHEDPEVLEEKLAVATPSEAAAIRAAEYAISARVADAARYAADAEDAYERAVLGEASAP